MTASRGVRRSLLAVAFVCLLAMAAGCADVGLAPRVPVAQDWTALPDSSVEKVTPAHQDLHSDLGVQVTWLSDTSTAVTQSQANRVFNYVVNLGANTVGIDFYFYTDGRHPSRVYGKQGITPSPQTISLLVANARRHGLRVLLRPLLNEDNLGQGAGNWRGTIEPKSVSAWFTSYYGFLQPYLEAAQESKATSFAIGTELDSLLADKNEWAAMENKASYVYSGALTFAVNWDAWNKNAQYEQVPNVAVDAYPPIQLGKSATVRQLTSAWRKWLKRQTSQTLRQTVLQEVGIAPADGAYSKPAAWGMSNPKVDSDIQRNWFSAACAAAKHAHMAGLYFYVVYNTDQPGDPASLLNATKTLSFTSISDTVIQACFNSGWS